MQPSHHPPGRERRDKFLLGQHPWRVIPGLIVIAVLTLIFLFQFLRVETGPAFVGSVQVLSAAAAWWLALGFIVLFGGIALGLALRLMTAGDGSKWVELDRKRIHAVGLGLTGSEVTIDYSGIEQVMVHKQRGFRGIEVRSSQGRLQILELRFTERHAFNVFHASLVAAVDGVDRRGIPAFRQS